MSLRGRRVLARDWPWLVLLLPPLSCFLFVLRDGVDVPFWDQWALVDSLEKLAHGKLAFADLWQQHNEHRLLVPRVVMLFLASLSGWNVRWEMFGSFVLIAATAALILWTLLGWGGLRTHSALAMYPVVALLFSLRQWENLLWGWQIQFYLCLFLAASAVAIATRNTGPVSEGAAIVCALGASLSLAAGFATWPAVLAVLSIRHSTGATKAWQAVRWCAYWAICLFAYLRNYTKPAHHPSLGFAVHEPARAALYFLELIGSPLADEPRHAAITGVFLLGFGTFAVFAYFGKDTTTPSAAFGLGLTVFALGAAVLVSVGRAGFGDGSAMSSRYTTLAGVLPLGTYIMLLARRGVAPVSQAVVTGAFVGVVLSGLLASIPGAIHEGNRIRKDRTALASAVRCFQSVGDAQLAAALPNVAELRSLAQVLEELRMGPFRTPCGSQ